MPLTPEQMDEIQTRKGKEIMEMLKKRSNEYSDAETAAKEAGKLLTASFWQGCSMGYHVGIMEASKVTLELTKETEPDKFDEAMYQNALEAIKDLDREQSIQSKQQEVLDDIRNIRKRADEIRSQMKSMRFHPQEKPDGE